MIRNKEICRDFAAILATVCDPDTLMNVVNALVAAEECEALTDRQLWTAENVAAVLMAAVEESETN
jgi:hypothetical protein